MPQVEAQHDDLRRIRRFVVECQQSSEQRLNGRDLEQSSDAGRPDELLRFALADQNATHRGVAGDLHRFCLLLPIEEAPGRRRADRERRGGVGDFAHRDETIGVGQMQRRQEHRIYHAEDRGVRADAERQRGDRDEREQRCAPERSRGESQILT